MSFSQSAAASAGSVLYKSAMASRAVW
jgi:hypothetical protein